MWGDGQYQNSQFIYITKYRSMYFDDFAVFLLTFGDTVCLFIRVDLYVCAKAH